MKSFSTPKKTFLMIIVFGICFFTYPFHFSFGLTKPPSFNREQLPITTDDQQASSTSKKTRSSFIKVAGFYLRDGKLITGKLLTEDAQKIIVEELKGSTIIVSTYNKRQVDSRSLKIKSLPEYKYYIQMAEYFAGRTWDFDDDPDDFIQAIRCYERAINLMRQSRRLSTEKIGQINQKIAHLQADREVWTRETESRAKLKKLEFDATFDTKIEQLEQKVTICSERINRQTRQLNRTLNDIRRKNEKLNKNFSSMKRDISRKMDTLASRIENNRNLINSYWRYYP